jgi:hypothetical protein
MYKVEILAIAIFLFDNENNPINSFPLNLLIVNGKISEK